MTDEIFSVNTTNSIFISHRHVDKELANVFFEEMSGACGDHTSINQSSSAPNISNIDSSPGVAIARAISESNLVFQERDHV